MPKTKKERVLIITDSPAITTGLAREGRELGLRFHQRNWDVGFVAWWHPNLQHNFPFKHIYPILRGSPHEPAWIKTAIDDFRPDTLLCIGDLWYFSHLKDTLEKAKHKVPERWLYLTLDGAPFWPDWVSTLQTFTRVYTHSHFALEEISKVWPDFRGKVVWPGVDRRIFRPLNEKDIKQAEPALADKFVVLVNASNCSRKNIPASIEAFSLFTKGKSDVVMILNTQQTSPNGSDLPRIINHFQIADKVLFEKNRTATSGIDDVKMNVYYNLADCLLSTTTGEGFSLPILEAFAARTPVLMTNYTTAEELLGKDRGLPLKVSSYICGERELRRAIVDINDTWERLEGFYEMRKMYGRKGREKYTQPAYDFVQNLTWESTFKNILEWNTKENWRSV